MPKNYREFLQPAHRRKISRLPVEGKTYVINDQTGLATFARRVLDINEDGSASMRTTLQHLHGRTPAYKLVTEFDTEGEQVSESTELLHGEVKYE